MYISGFSADDMEFGDQRLEVDLHVDHLEIRIEHGDEVHAGTITRAEAISLRNWLSHVL